MIGAPEELEQLTMTEIIRLQDTLSQVLKRRFEKNMALVFTDIVGSTPYFQRFGNEAGRGRQQRHFDLLTGRPLPHTELKGISRAVELLLMDWRDHSKIPASCLVEETGEVIQLPDQDIISFGRLKENEGIQANDIVLTHHNATITQQIS